MTSIATIFKRRYKFPKLIREDNYKFYFGIFSSVGLRIIGFAFIAISQLILARYILGISDLVTMGEYNAFENINYELVTLLFNISNVGKPLIIVSIFIKVFVKQDRPIKTLIITGILAILFYGFEILIYNFILYPFVMALFEVYGIDPIFIEVIIPYIDTFVVSFTNLNIFLDTSLCLLIYLFLVYQPKSLTGKKIIPYRLLSIIPIAHIVATYVINVLINLDILEVKNIYANALFTKGSLPTFAIFFIIIIFVRLFRRFYHKTGFKAPYRKFIKTNRYGFYFSLTIATALIIISLFEFAFSYIPDCKHYLIGQNYWLFLGAPFVMLFNVNRKCNSKVPQIMHPLWLVTHYLFFAGATFGAVDSILTLLSSIFN